MGHLKQLTQHKLDTAKLYPEVEVTCLHRAQNIKFQIHSNALLWNQTASKSSNALLQTNNELMQDACKCTEQHLQPMYTWSIVKHKHSRIFSSNDSTMFANQYSVEKQSQKRGNISEAHGVQTSDCIAFLVQQPRASRHVTQQRTKNSWMNGPYIPRDCGST